MNRTMFYTTHSVNMNVEPHLGNVIAMVKFLPVTWTSNRGTNTVNRLNLQGRQTFGLITLLCCIFESCFFADSRLYLFV